VWGYYLEDTINAFILYGFACSFILYTRQKNYYQPVLDKESKVNENKINLKHNSDTIILWLL